MEAGETACLWLNWGKLGWGVDRQCLLVKPALSVTWAGCTTWVAAKWLVYGGSGVSWAVHSGGATGYSETSPKGGLMQSQKASAWSCLSGWVVCSVTITFTVCV